MITKGMLDKRICDVEKEADNTQTYREFIRESEGEFCMSSYPLDYDDTTDEEINEYFEFLCELWSK